MEEEIIKKIFCLYRAFKKKLDMYLRQKKTNFIDFHILYFLNKEKIVSHKRLAKVLNISLPTLNFFLSRLLKKKLIKQRDNPEDKREVLVSLSEQGKNFFDLIHQEMVSRSKFFFADLNQEQIRKIDQWLEKILVKVV